MSTNWRSDQSLVDAVQAIFKSVEDPFRHAEIQLPHVEAQYEDRLPGQPALVVRFVPRHPQATPDKAPNQASALQQAIRGMVIDMVTQLNDPPAITYGEELSRRVVPGDLATLCRTGKQLRQIQRELAARGVPAVLHTDESVFESQEAEATAHVMRALHNRTLHTQLADEICDNESRCETRQARIKEIENELTQLLKVGSAKDVDEFRRRGEANQNLRQLVELLEDGDGESDAEDEVEPIAHDSLSPNLELVRVQPRMAENPHELMYQHNGCDD